ncbi:unnamed protein product [Rotaria sp. Silwood1]|nr:unnamed protein product [Rotaria sp. Silwood1]CAF4578297.1 unnamed protein product [Rotaria sp. Silwood1]
MLYVAGTTNRFGKIEEGNTASDYHKDEVDKQISINSSVLNTTWKNSKGELRKINIIDTPGYIDFLGEVKSSLRVTDTSVLLIDSFKGREVGTELSFHYTQDYENNIIFVINKLDQENSDFDKCIEQLRESFGSEVAVVQFPLNPGPAFDAVVDVARMKVLRFKSDGKGDFTEEDIPDALKEKANEYHKQFVEVIAAEEDSLMEKFFENEENLPEEDINYGVKPVMDFIAEYAESPLEKPAERGHSPNKEDHIDVAPNPKGEPCLFIFKTVSEKNIGELSFFRVYSGCIKPGMDLINEANGKTERISQLYYMNGKDRKEVTELMCGDIAAVVKLKDTHTNNTLSSKNFPVVLPYIIYPEHNMTLAIFPKKKGEEDKIAAALHTLHEEDPTFIVTLHKETHQTLISGQGEMHLNVIINRIKTKFGLEVEVEEPKIPYRETIRAIVKDSEFKYKKQSGGHGQYGHVHIKLEPNDRGVGFEFINEIVGGVIPGKFIPAVEKGILEVLPEGVIAGYPVVDEVEDKVDKFKKIASLSLKEPLKLDANYETMTGYFYFNIERNIAKEDTTFYIIVVSEMGKLDSLSDKKEGVILLNGENTLSLTAETQIGEFVETYDRRYWSFYFKYKVGKPDLISLYKAKTLEMKCYLKMGGSEAKFSKDDKTELNAYLKKYLLKGQV